MIKKCLNGKIWVVFVMYLYVHKGVFENDSFFLFCFYFFTVAAFGVFIVSLRENDITCECSGLNRSITKLCTYG